MTKEQAKEHIETLAKKASDTKNASEALHFSQAANNIANALVVINAPGL
jgi:hypothetical protein